MSNITTPKTPRRQEIFILPESFEATDFVSERQADNANWLVATLHTAHRRQCQQSFGSVPRGETGRTGAASTTNVPLLCLGVPGRMEPVSWHWKALKRMMGDDYAKTIEALERAEVLRRVGNYRVGSHTYRYQLSDRFIADKHIRLPVTSAAMKRRLESLWREDGETQRKRRLPIHDELARRQLGLEIDGAAARGYLDEHPASNPWDCQGVLVHNIEERELGLRIGRYGRVFNAICNLKSDLRRFLTIGGEGLDSVDVSNSQPALLGLLAWKSETLDFPLPRFLGDATRGSTAEYISAVQAGRIYEVLEERLPASFTRDRTKKRVLVDVLAKDTAKRGNYPAAVEDAFRAEFPDVHRWIRQINADDHATLIRLLQRLEAQLVIGRVCGRIMTAHPDLPLVSLHDAVFTIQGALSWVVEAFDEVFGGDLDFPITTKTEGVGQ